jgi:hypothetical protein
MAFCEECFPLLVPPTPALELSPIAPDPRSPLALPYPSPPVQQFGSRSLAQERSDRGGAAPAPAGAALNRVLQPAGRARQASSVIVAAIAKR